MVLELKKILVTRTTPQINCLLSRCVGCVILANSQQTVVHAKFMLGELDELRLALSPVHVPKLKSQMSEVLLFNYLRLDSSSCAGVLWL